MTVLKLKDGRVLNGALIAGTDRTVTLRSATESVALERSDIAATETSALSQMPEGLLDALTPEQIRDLIAYLQHPNQVPLKE
jgi:putative heme-binding domain-containing protein